jgi:2-hydroxychromene-2-carboxylate isomerase
VVWRPVLLGAIYRATNAPQGAAGSASDTFNPTKRAITGKAFQRTLKRQNIKYNEPPLHPQKTTAPLRLLYFVDEADRPRLTHALYRAYWVDGRNMSEKETLIDAVRQSSLAGSERIIQAIRNGSFEGTNQRHELEVATDMAVKHGAFGVPGFWIPAEIWTDKNGTQKQGRLYWGQDRMHFVEAVLLALNEGKNGNDLGSVSKPLRGLIPRCTRLGIPSGEEVKLEFWYDFSSPWAFLGWTQLDALRRQFGSGLQIEMKPFLLGILFREHVFPLLYSVVIC